MLGLDGIHQASSSGIGPRASARSSRLTTIGLSRRFLAGSNAAADNYRIGNARSSFHGGLSRTRVRLPPPPPHFPPHGLPPSHCPCSLVLGKAGASIVIVALVSRPQELAFGHNTTMPLI